MRAAAGDTPIVAAFDPVAGQTAQVLLNALSSGGELFLYGGLSGEPMAITAMQLARDDLAVKGFWLMPVLEKLGADRRATMLDELHTLLRHRQLEIPVAGIVDLADIQQAVVQAQVPRRLGKIVLRP